MPPPDRHGQVIVRSIVQSGQAAGLQIVAGDVEKDRQADFLQ